MPGRDGERLEVALDKPSQQPGAIKVADLLAGVNWGGSFFTFHRGGGLSPLTPDGSHRLRWKVLHFQTLMIR